MLGRATEANISGGVVVWRTLWADFGSTLYFFVYGFDLGGKIAIIQDVLLVGVGYEMLDGVLTESIVEVKGEVGGAILADHGFEVEVGWKIAGYACDSIEVGSRLITGGD